MKLLLGTIVAGTAKRYVVPKFEEMCAALFPDVDVLAVVDQPGRTRLPELVDRRVGNTIWATEICYWGKHHALRDYALANGYDALVWQGVDCLYSTRQEFDMLVDGLGIRRVMGALVAGRNRENYPVCRQFEQDGDTFSTRAKETPWITDSQYPGLFTIPGYIGSDATIIRRDALETVSMDGYIPWETRSEAQREDPAILGPDDYWMWSAVARHGIWPTIDTRVRPWHSHEDGRTVRYKGEVCKLADITWSNTAP